MRRVICLLLVVVFCMALACPAFAATKDSPSSVTDCGKGNHKYNSAGICTICGAVRPYYSGSNPKTGDMTMVWAGGMVLSLSALAAVAVIYRKKFA